MKYPRGSEWRKWDLHVHTPASAGYSGTYDQLMTQIYNSEACVIGINDYFTIDGYKEVKSRLREDCDKAILPIVEMRMNNVLTNRHRSNAGTRINFHIIFNPYDEKKSKDIIPFVESFIKAIKYKKVSGQDGLISDIYNDKYALLHDVTVDYNAVLDELACSSELAGNYLVWLPYDEYGGVDEVNSRNFPFKPALINRAHIIGSSNPKQIEYFLGGRDDYYEYFNAKKPCIKGSDANSHDYPLGKLKDASSKPLNKYCWIKADPTFEGLKQIVQEPRDRVFIGEIPDKLALVGQNKTKYVQAISIKKIPGSACKDIWFNNDLEFNSGLIAIIGNKGKGKSALAEILGLLGNSRNYEHFSFLKDAKFKKNKLASNFEGKIKWMDYVDQSSINLLNIPDRLKVERIKCIPQNYLEILCNNLDKKFQEQVDNVIFSHLDESELLGKANLNDLISYKTQILDENISKIQVDIGKFNEKIIDLEEKLKPEYSKRLKDRLSVITDELKSHYGIRPKRVSRPPSRKAAKKEDQELCVELQKINREIKGIEVDIKSKKKNLVEINEKYERLSIVKGRIRTFEDGYKDLVKEIGSDLKELLGVELAEIVDLKIEYKKINEKILETERVKKVLANLLTVNQEQHKKLDKEAKKENLYVRLKEKQDLQNKLQEQVDEPLRRYQNYLECLKEWKISFHRKNTERKGIRTELKRVASELPKLLSSEQSGREKLIGDLFKLLEKKVAVYEVLYKPVIDFIKDERGKNKYMELNFSAEIMLAPEFNAKFLSHIDRGKKGSFHGVKESEILVREIEQKYNFSQSKDVISFVNEIIEKLCAEIELDKKIPRVIEDQLVSGESKHSLYSYLYLLKFLKIDYRLKWGDKLLDDLSPGERGAVLLIFYLLIDKSNLPLIIDQPEENLDNESVYYLLVRYIKEAKRRRQIFIVTHNPNLAVVCDAEQIIYCNLDKKGKYKVSYEMGSIENNQIKQKIIDILEGTPPAFTNRRDKYELRLGR